MADTSSMLPLGAPLWALELLLFVVELDCESAFAVDD
jgi:hypothetical protein